MATFLDIGLLKGFERLFSFLFIFVTSYAVLTKVKFPTDNKGLQSLVAILLAVFTSMSDGASAFIAQVSPWFIVLFMIIIFLMIANMIFGVTESDITGYWKAEDSVMPTWILVISVIIVLLVGSSVFGSTFLSFTNTTSNSGDIGQNIGAAIFHPRMLGFIAVMLVGVFSILLLSKTAVLVKK